MRIILTILLILIISLSGCYTRIFPPVDEQAQVEPQPVYDNGTDTSLENSGDYSRFIFPMSPDFYYQNYYAISPYGYYSPFYSPYDYAYYDPYYFSYPSGYYGYPGIGFYGYYDPYTYSYNFFGNTGTTTQSGEGNSTDDEDKGRKENPKGRKLPTRERTVRGSSTTAETGIFFPGYLPPVTSSSSEKSSSQEQEKGKTKSRKRVEEKSKTSGSRVKIRLPEKKSSQDSNINSGKTKRSEIKKIREPEVKSTPRDNPRNLKVRKRTSSRKKKED